MTVAADRTRRAWRALVLGAVVLFGASLAAHHSFGAIYLEEDTIEVEGEIVEFEYRNPHSFVHVQAPDPFGRAKQYAAEWASTSRLESDGITRNTLRPGDTVRIWASPSKNPADNRIRLKRIERRADGWRWGQQRRETR
jgi:hypothetical protein